MRIRWRNFELPTRVVVDKESGSNKYGKFVIEPFERGFGTTIGNGLRRVLLSSIEGTAVATVKIEGVVHEFSTIPGVYEDMTDMILNIKQLRVKLHDVGSATLVIEKKGKGDITAGDIKTDENAEIVNRDLHIATITDDIPFRCELQVRKGRGYVPAEENVGDEQEHGVIPVDSIFSPVHRVKYSIENTRVGKFTNYDRLVMEIWTDGTITPEEALVESSKIYRKHLNPFVQYFESKDEALVSDEISVPVARAEKSVEKGGSAILDRPIEELELSVRAKNCLDSEQVRTIGQLVSRSENDLLNIKNLGKTSLTEIKKKIEDLGLTLGMPVGGAVPAPAAEEPSSETAGT